MAGVALLPGCDQRKLHLSLPMLALVSSASASFAAPSGAPAANLKSPLPWLPRPAYLDGTLAGDVGLDPLQFVTKYQQGVTFKVPALRTEERAPADSSLTSLKTVVDQQFFLQEITLGPNIKSGTPQEVQRSLMWMREAEVKHARLASAER